MSTTSKPQNVHVVQPHRKNPQGPYGGGGEEAMITGPALPAQFVQKFSHHQAPVWRTAMLLQENMRLNVSHLWDIRYSN